MLLKTIEIEKHPILKNVIVSFDHKAITKNSFIVIIGANGTGKSYFLKTISEIFNDLIARNNGIKKKPILKYLYKVTYTSNGIDQVTSNDDENSVEVPSRIIASAISLNDKFPILSAKDQSYNSSYKYLGIRTASNNVFLSKNKGIFFQNLLLIIQDSRKMECLREALATVNLSSRFTVSFKNGRYFKKVANSYYGSRSVDKFIENFTYSLKNEIEKSKEGKVIRYSDDKILSYLKKGNIQKLISGMEYLSNGELKDFTIDLNDQSNVNGLGPLGYFVTLLELGIVDIKEIAIKGNTKYSFDQASSGEFHLLSSISSIIRELEDESLLLIDEPEISLHPNWQINYLDILEKAIKNFSKIQVIIATHSHFILSSLESSSGLVVKASLQEKQLTLNQLEFAPEGMSPENILYNVFGVTSFHNHYFEMDLRKMVNLISEKSRNIEEIEFLYNKINKFKFDKNDPLMKVMIQVKSYIEDFS